MRIRLAYGETGLLVDLPDDRTTVVAPRQADGVPDPAATVRAALRRPVAGPPLPTGSAAARPSRSRCATAPGRSRGT